MDTNPTEVSEEQATEAFANILGVSESEDDQTEEATEAEETEQEAEEGQSEQVEEAEEEEDVALGDLTLKLPKSQAQKVKDGVLMQADYTRKTQELAEERRFVSAMKEQQQQIAQFQETAFEKAAELRALEQQAALYEKVDWSSLDSDTFNRADREHRVLQGKVDRARQEMQGVVRQHQEATAKERQLHLEREVKALQSIDGWGVDLQKKIVEHGKTYGFSEQELAQISDSRIVKALNDARQWRELRNSKAEVTKKVATAKPMKVTGRGAPQAQQGARVTEARTQLKKTGDAKHAEAIFESMFNRRK